jgi:FkbH-like protein
MSDCSTAAARILDAATGRTVAAKSRAIREALAVRSEWLGTVRCRFLRNYALEPIVPHLQFEGLHRELRIEPTFADFDSFEREAVDVDSETWRGQYDLIVVSLWLDGLLERNQPQQVVVESIANRLTLQLDRLQETGATIVVATLLPPFFSLGAGFDIKGGGRPVDTVDELNYRLRRYTRASDRVFLIDMGRLLMEVGETAALDRRLWYLYRSPLKAPLLERLARAIASLAAGLRGTAKKVLALDCDNTLWGGIIGEDGISGIALDPATSPGAAFYDFQRQILQLKDEGVLLTLCSRNNEADVLQVLDQHPHSVLGRSDLSAWQIGWGDKAEGLQQIARSLNLALDSFVFVDDSSMECERVRGACPEVTVLQVTNELADLPLLLRDFRGFDRIRVSAEDFARTDMYRAESQRRTARGAFADLADHLASLGLEVTIGRARSEDVPRVAQLIQKTNQFNLTTRRYTEPDVRAFCENPRALVLTMRVRDRFGNYGLTGVAILAEKGETVEIDSLLLSCRVLGRDVERAFLAQIWKWANVWPGTTRLLGRYVPTAKNQQVADFYERSGFVRLNVEGSVGSGMFVFDLRGTAAPVPTYIRVVEDSDG